jgi:RNA polymerase sigma factor (sigma-70 family)
MTGTVALMESCIPALRRYAGTLLRDRQEVDDLVHDCLVRALDRLHTRRSDGELRPWLFAIMHNLYISRTRQKRSRGSHEPIEELTDESLSVEGGQERRLHAYDVMEAVERLPEDLRSVLLLVTVEDMAYAEVSKILGIPIGTVMSRLARARERVRRDCQREPAAVVVRLK